MPITQSQRRDAKRYGAKGQAIAGAVYAVGDVHGCADALHALLARMPLRDEDRVVFLGDAIDRGPDSAAAIALIRGLGNRAVALMGNHERLMLDAYASGEHSPDWLRWMMNGGEATLASFGGAVPRDVLAWAEVLPLCWDVMVGAQHLFFVHAGIDPKRALEDQDAETMLWIRAPFLRHPGPLPALVVHGHTPNLAMVEEQPWRINLDAGCCYGGELVAAVFAPGDQRIFSRRPVDPLRSSPPRLPLYGKQ